MAAQDSTIQARTRPSTQREHELGLFSLIAYLISTAVVIVPKVIADFVYNPFDWHRIFAQFHHTLPRITGYR